MLEIHIYLNSTLRQACRDTLATSIPACLAWSDHHEHKAARSDFWSSHNRQFFVFSWFVAQAFAPL